jgi:ankyrin repeat protein
VTPWPDGDRTTLLHQASQMGDVNVAHFLIKYSTNVSVLDKYDLTLYHEVSELGSVDLTCLLVEHSDDPDGD